MKPPQIAKHELDTSLKIYNFPAPPFPAHYF
jgi:hypothetical protein